MININDISHSLLNISISKCEEARAFYFAYSWNSILIVLFFRSNLSEIAYSNDFVSVRIIFTPNQLDIPFLYIYRLLYTIHVIAHVCRTCGNVKVSLVHLHQPSCPIGWAWQREEIAATDWENIQYFTFTTPKYNFTQTPNTFNFRLFLKYFSTKYRKILFAEILKSMWFSVQNNLCFHFQH